MTSIGVQSANYYQFLEKTTGKVFNVLEDDLQYVEGLPSKDDLQETIAYFVKCYYYQMGGSFIYLQKKNGPVHKSITQIETKNNFFSSFITINETN